MDNAPEVGYATMNLRWKNGILQQEYRIEMAYSGVRYEWRDVETVEE